MQELGAALCYLNWGQDWFSFAVSAFRDASFTFWNIRAIRAGGLPRARRGGFLPVLLIWRPQGTADPGAPGSNGQ